MFPVSLVIPQCLTIEPWALFCVPDLLHIHQCWTVGLSVWCYHWCWPRFAKTIADDLASKHMTIGCQAWICLFQRRYAAGDIFIVLKYIWLKSSRSWIEFSVLDPDMHWLLYLKKQFEDVEASTGVDWHFRSVNFQTVPRIMPYHFHV